LTLFLAHQLICPSCQYAAGFFSCYDGQITGTFSRVFCPHEGRFAIVTKRWSEDAVDVTSAKDESACRGRRSHVVLTPRRWRQIGDDAFRIALVTVTKSPITGESVK
jgi:hypothetical protein